MLIRNIRAEDAGNFFEMMCRLDEETEYMMYEPGERREKTPNLDRLKARIEGAASGGDLLIVADTEEGEIAGFLWAERGGPNRVKHTAYIVTGIRQAYRRQGIGTAFFRRLEDWAMKNGVTRLELTVECENTAAVSLYKKMGFRIEGTRPQSMKVNGRFVDEYYMGRILR